jgi:glyoxylase-like metal-dependent hydrolase (beta-lactamase superfamily II)
MIATIRLSLSNAFLVLGARAVLVDAGSPGEEGKILNAMQKHGVAPRDVAVILLTHGHRDHVGSAAALREATGASIAMHCADFNIIQRGHMGRLTPLRARHRVLEPFVNRPFAPLEVDCELVHDQRLDEQGLAGRVVATPGHSAGSVSLLLDDGNALVGDLLIGGFLGGIVDRHRPRLPYFAEDVAILCRSVTALLPQVSGQLFVGHGGPLDAQRVNTWCERPGWSSAFSRQTTG